MTNDQIEASGGREVYVMKGGKSQKGGKDVGKGGKGQFRGMCFGCKGYGHKQDRCPNNPTCGKGKAKDGGKGSPYGKGGKGPSLSSWNQAGWHSPQQPQAWGSSWGPWHGRAAYGLDAGGQPWEESAGFLCSLMQATDKQRNSTIKTQNKFAALSQEVEEEIDEINRELVELRQDMGSLSAIGEADFEPDCRKDEVDMDSRQVQESRRSRCSLGEATKVQRQMGGGGTGHREAEPGVDQHLRE